MNDIIHMVKRADSAPTIDDKIRYLLKAKLMIQAETVALKQQQKKR